LDLIDEGKTSPSRSSFSRHNNLAYTRACLERIEETTENYDVVVGR